MFYSVRHVTRFHYSAPVSESLMEVRMRPRTEGNQRVIQFSLTTVPKTSIHFYRDHLGNTVHHFDVPGSHARLSVTAESLVEVDLPAPLPDELAPSAWEDLDRAASTGEYYEYLNPSSYAQYTGRLRELAAELRVERRADPLQLLRELNSSLFEAFAYCSQTTHVDSPIDHALEERRGVCQDFAHIMIALLRGIGIPCRYVSGYLFHRGEDHDRSADGATHAWAEAWLPELGWVGFDPTNNLIAGDRHIRTAVGRDYSDVPPTKGVFKGRAGSTLSVAVRVATTQAPADDVEIPPAVVQTYNAPPFSQELLLEQQQQQQQ